MNAIRVRWAKRFANAKGDHEEARHFVACHRLRQEAKRVLTRARRRYDRSLCAHGEAS